MDAATQKPKLNMTTEPQRITLGPATLVYLEKRGPFMVQAPRAWKEFHTLAQGKFAAAKSLGMVGLSRIDPTLVGDDANIYQAGMLFEAKPDSIPPELAQRELKKADYARFLLTGSYSQFPAAYPAAFAILEKSAIRLRNDFCIERYLNTPNDVPEHRLETEILIPIA